MTIENQIHTALIRHCGSALNVKGISQTQLVNLKQGTSTITVKKLDEIFRLNGMSGTLKIEASNCITIIKLY